MPIRSGSGGLKYPLPNFAQLAAQQSAAAASAGGSASASAYGANRQFAANKMRVQADLANAAADRNFRAQSQMQEQGYRATQNYIDRELGAQQQRYAQDAMAERQAAGQQFSAEQAELDRGFTTERDQARFEQDQVAFEREVDAGIERDIQAGKLELNPKQQQTLRELDDVGPKELEGYDEAQRQEFEQQRDARRREIIRSARPPQTTAKGQAERSLVHFDPQTKGYVGQPGPNTVPGTIGKDGQFQPIEANPNQAAEQKAEQKQRENEQKQKEDLYKESNDIMSEDTLEGQEPRTFDSAYEEAIRRRNKAGLPAPSQGDKAPVPLPPGHPNAQKGGLGAAPAAPLAPPAGLADSIAARSGDNMPVTLQERLPANPGYQAPAGPRTLPETPGSSRGVVATPLGGQPQFITGPDGKIYVRQK